MKKTKYKILFVANTSSMYGANQSMLSLIKFLIKENEVFVMLPRQGDIVPELEKIGCSYSVENYYSCVSLKGEVNWRYWFNIFCLYKMYMKFHKQKPDIIHTNTSTLDIGARLAKILKVPHVWHVREFFEHYEMRCIRPQLYKKLRQESARVFCISQTVFEGNAKYYTTENMRVIYNGFVIPEKKTCECAIRDNGMVELLVAGMIFFNKGQEDAIKAVEVLVKEMQKRVHLTIVGHAERKYLEYITKLIAERRLEKYVDILPFTNRLSELREKCDIMLQCSRFEGLGRVTIESMLERRIVVGADSGATHELIENGVNGFLYTPGNYRQLAEKIAYIIENGLECVAIIEEAYNRAKINFADEKIGKMVYEEYKSILQKVL